jgi:hypothetical protein
VALTDAAPDGPALTQFCDLYRFVVRAATWSRIGARIPIGLSLDSTRVGYEVSVP